MRLSRLNSKGQQCQRESPLSFGTPLGTRTRSVLLAVSLAVMCGSGMLFVAFHSLAAPVDRCRLDPDGKGMRCRTDFLTVGSANQPQLGNELNSWRLVRTPNPAGGPAAVAAMRTAESARSDLEFAGLMLRCGEVAPDVLVVLVRPLPIHSHPNVAIDADGSSVNLIATVVPPGVLVLLPPEAAALARGSWRRSAEVKITVAEKGISISGVVSLAGLDATIPQLEASCPAR